MNSLNETRPFQLKWLRELVLCFALQMGCRYCDGNARPVAWFAFLMELVAKGHSLLPALHRDVQIVK